MPSPFPGMDPYLEQPAFWPDFHSRLLVELAERLVAIIRPRYFVLLERHVFVQEPPGEPATIRLRPDVLNATSARREEGGVAIVEAAAPVEVEHLAVEVERVSYLEVREAASGDVVTVIELLSPANKREGRFVYLARREKVLGSPVHLVEIGLLRGRKPMPDFTRPPCAYSVLVSHADGRPRAGSGRSGSASDCRKSPSRCVRPTRPRRSTSGRSCTGSTTARPTRTSSIAAGPTRRWTPTTPPGPRR